MHTISKNDERGNLNVIRDTDDPNASSQTIKYAHNAKTKVVLIIIITIPLPTKVSLIHTKPRENSTSHTRIEIAQYLKRDHVTIM